jgi:hypothetical protein
LILKKCEITITNTQTTPKRDNTGSAPVKSFREWRNMIGYEMGSSLMGVYTTAKTSPVKRLSTDEKMT